MQVSLITCTNNSEKTIQDCCLSLSSQTHNNIEHIILDNNSQDRTISLIKQNETKNFCVTTECSDCLNFSLSNLESFLD